MPTPLPFEDMLFLISDGGIASCLKTTTGETLWRERLEGNYFASPVLVNGKVCIVSAEGDVRVLSITKEKMTVLGLSKLNETPTIRPPFLKKYFLSHLLHPSLSEFDLTRACHYPLTRRASYSKKVMNVMLIFRPLILLSFLICSIQVNAVEVAGYSFKAPADWKSSPPSNKC